MKDYSLQISINTILKNSGILNLNKEIDNLTKTTTNFTEKIAKAGAEFVAISELAKPLKNAIGGLFT